VSHSVNASLYILVLCFAEELKITYSKSPVTNRCTVIPKGILTTDRPVAFCEMFQCILII